MTSVFLGGSRSVAALTPDVKARIDNVIEKGFNVLVGDANGGDKSVQRYLAERGYRNVTVYCTEGKCRNNIGEWALKSVPFTGRKSDGFAFYAAKDDAMANDADYGLMVWDGKSRGTLRNVINLTRQEKMTAVYFAPDRRFVNVRNLDEAHHLLGLCAESAARYLDESSSLSNSGQTAFVTREQRS